MSGGVNAATEPGSRPNRDPARDAFVRQVLMPFVLARGALAIAASAALAFGTPREGFRTHAIGAVDALVRWDAEHYLTVADLGYGAGADAFFPLYPALVRVVGWVMPLPYAAVLVANLACLAALELLRRLVAHEHGPTIAARAVQLAIVFPTGFFLSAAYAESTYLACTLLVFLAARERRHGLAAVAVWLACLARPQGFVVTTLPFVVGWLVSGRSRATLPWFVLGALPALGQLLAMHQLATGDALGFLHADSVRSLAAFRTGPAAAPPPMLAVLLDEGFGPNLVRRLANLAALLLVGATAIAETRARRVPYALLAVFTVAMPLAFQRTIFDAASMGRYAAIAFPIYPFLARVSEREPVGEAAMRVFPLLQLVFFVAFASRIWAE